MKAQQLPVHMRKIKQMISPLRSFFTSVIAPIKLVTRECEAQVLYQPHGGN